MPRRWTYLHPILFAAYPVLFLYAGNTQHSVAADALRPLLVAVVAGGLALAVPYLLLRRGDVSALVGTELVFAAFFAYPAIAVVAIAFRPLIPADLVPVFYGPVLIGATLLAIAGVVVATIALVRSPRVERRLPAVNGGLTVAAAVLVVFQLVPIAGYMSQSAPGRSLETSSLVAQRVPTRDIYYLVFDRYGSNDALASAFGVHDNDLPAWLQEHGFFVATQSHANYDRTVMSVPATLNLDYLDSAIQSMDPYATTYGPLIEMMQDHRVGRFLQAQGYEYVHLGNWYSPTASIRIANRNLRPASITELEARLIDETFLPNLTGVLTGQSPVPAEEQLHMDTALYQFDTLARLPAEQGPKFVYAHILLPHDPFVFDRDGNYVPLSERVGLTLDERFQEQLVYTNTRIKTLLTALLAGSPVSQPIVVVQADEGPYPPRYSDNQTTFEWTTATEDEVRTKFGILNAFYFPASAEVPPDAPQPYPTISSVNTFRLLFDRYFGTDLPMLPDRSFAAAQTRYPYRLIEVTDRLAP